MTKAWKSIVVDFAMCDSIRAMEFRQFDLDEM